MTLFGRELTLEQVMGFVQCNANPNEDLVHRAALELVAALKAAIADIKHGDNCEVCKHNVEQPECDCECLDCGLDCMCKDFRDESLWEWRGPQEAGEGERDGD